jgi:Ca-activated chloride channel homolog
MKITNFILPFLLVSMSFAQIKVDYNEYNFGLVDKESNRWTDFKITNQTASYVYLMRANTDKDVQLYYLRDKIEKDSSAYIRVLYNPSVVGPFKKNIDIYISSQAEPIRFTITGNASFVVSNEDVACPDFSSQKPLVNVKNQRATVVVIDKKSNQPIINANVNIAPPYGNNMTLLTNKQGKTSFNTSLGTHQIFVAAEGYEPKEVKHEISVNENYMTIYLSAKEKIVFQQNEVDDEQNVEIQQPASSIFLADETSIFSEHQLPISEYKPNNIVFLLDISNSMSYLEKENLLKMTINEMLKTMRSIDYISVITYSTTAEVLFSAISGKENLMMMDKINGLKAEGLTAGGKGIKTAYEIAWDNFIPKGNNQIILITDGAFNITEEGYNLNKEVRMNALRGVKLSIVGVKTGRKFIGSLQSLAKKGMGNYVHIKNEDEAKIGLLNEVKSKSKY